MSSLTGLKTLPLVIHSTNIPSLWDSGNFSQRRKGAKGAINQPLFLSSNLLIFLSSNLLIFFSFLFSLFTFPFSLFTFHFSLFTFHFSLFTFHFSLFTFHFSLFPFTFYLSPAFITTFITLLPSPVLTLRK
jgi:hypothetical protein